MRFRSFLVAAAASASLAACATDPAYLQSEQYQRDLASSAAFLQRAQAQAPQITIAPAATPQVTPLGQPGAAIVYCRDLNGSIIACRQVN